MLMGLDFGFCYLGLGPRDASHTELGWAAGQWALTAEKIIFFIELCTGAYPPLQPGQARARLGPVRVWPSTAQTCLGLCSGRAALIGQAESSDNFFG